MVTLSEELKLIKIKKKLQAVKLSTRISLVQYSIIGILTGETPVFILQVCHNSYSRAAGSKDHTFRDHFYSMYRQDVRLLR